jgi:hypothetical protein
MRTSAGAKQKPVSEDPKIQERRDKARQAYAKKQGAKTGASSSSVSVLPLIPPSLKIIETAVVKGAKNTIGRAIKNKLERTVAKKKLEEKRKGFGVMVDIKLPMSDVERYFRQYPKAINFLKSKGYDTDDVNVPLKYRSYLDYDFFIFEYDNGKQYQIKINTDADINYSSYLYDKYFSKVNIVGGVENPLSAGSPVSALSRNSSYISSRSSVGSFANSRTTSFDNSR